MPLVITRVDAPYSDGVPEDHSMEFPRKAFPSKADAEAYALHMAERTAARELEKETGIDDVIHASHTPLSDETKDENGVKTALDDAKSAILESTNMTTNPDYGETTIGWLQRRFIANGLRIVTLRAEKDFKAFKWSHRTTNNLEPCVVSIAGKLRENSPPQVHVAFTRPNLDRTRQKFQFYEDEDIQVCLEPFASPEDALKKAREMRDIHADREAKVALVSNLLPHSTKPKTDALVQALLEATEPPIGHPEGLFADFLLMPHLEGEVNLSP